jgi:phosphate uptake regulator
MIPRMNRTLKESADQPLSPLMGTLAITGYAAETNLRDVAQALVEKDTEVFERAGERNKKLARLRVEIDGQVAIEMAKASVGKRAQKGLRLASDIALMFEKFGSHTVEIARLCEQLVQKPKPSRVVEIIKLIEHVIFIPDRATQAFIDDDLEWAKGAVERSLAADELYNRIESDLKSLEGSPTDTDGRLEILKAIAAETHRVLELVKESARAVVTLLESTDL